jgi:tetratricopeptide (TPR) repeat protein
VGGVVAALVVSRFVHQREPGGFASGEKPSAKAQPGTSRTELRQLADAVYLRFLQDEAARAPAEKLSRAIAGVASARKQTPEAVRDALTRYAALVESDPQRNAYETSVAATMRGNFEAASSALPLGTEPAAPADALTAALGQINAHIAARRFDEAERALADARRRLDRTREAEGWARVQAAAFALRYAQDRVAEAFTFAREVLEIRERVLPPDSPGLANALHNAGVCLARLHRDDEAVPLFQRALGIYEKAYGPDDLEVASTVSELADALSESDRLPEAEAAARRAIALYERAGEDSAIPLALALDRLGNTLLAAKRNPDAETPLRRAVAIYDHRPDARAKDHSDAVHRLALSIARQDRRRESLPYFKRGAEIAAKWFTDDDPLFAVHFHNMAVWADGAGDDALTIEGYERALQILAKNQRRTKQEPAQMQQTRDFYAAYLKRAGQSDAEIERKLREATR